MLKADDINCCLDQVLTVFLDHITNPNEKSENNKTSFNFEEC
jgi:hypothetical protein